MTSPYLFRPKSVGAHPRVNALTKYIGGHGNALGGSITDTGLFDWTRYPNIHDNVQGAEDRRYGASRRSARRDCATGVARWPPSRRTISRSARRRWRCAWTAPAPTRMALATLLASRSRGSRGPLPGPRIASAARARRRSCSRAYGALLSFELDPRHRLLRLPQSARGTSCCRRTSATIARWRFPSRTRFSTRWARSGAQAWASRIR